ncbi:MAG TPA: Gldg family protein [Steroidobacteraceae bacterium]|nr:Gldg family protein [Steroidobacteraceae bacterium]
MTIRSRSTLGGGALLALAFLFIGLTILFGHTLRGWRIDLTENNLYTTAPGTERILKSLKEPVNLYFFYSADAARQLPQIRTYGTRVKEFLEEIEARSNAKVRLKVIDPEPFSEDEDRASELGIRSVPFGASGSQLYFGLAGTNSTDGRAAIEFFDPGKEQFLEYDIAKLVHQLGNPKKPVIGWLSGLPMSAGFDPMSGQMREPWAVVSQAEQLFTVRQLEPALTKIEADVDVLVIVHPKELPPAAQFAIDQYALRGGRVFVFVDPLAEQDRAGADPGNPMAALGADRSSNLATLFGAWGVEFNPREVVGDLEHALQVTMRSGEEPVRHLGILGLTADAFSESDVVTAGLSSINVATTGAVRQKKDSKLKFEPLLQSSTQSAPIPVERFAMLFDPASLRDGFKPTGERYTFAARVTGNIATAFPGGPPAGAALAAGETALEASAKPLNLIVVADTDLLSDFLWVRQQSFFGQRIAQAWANNGDFVLNGLDNLAGSTDLISVRGRAAFTRPFDRVDDLRIAAEDRFRTKEQELEAELRATEEKLTQLESGRNEQSALILTPEQQSELERFQREKLRIRKELRDVRLGLEQDIRGLGNTVKVLNIVVVPVIFAAIALLAAAFRRRQRQRRRAATVMVQKEATP